MRIEIGPRRSTGLTPDFGGGIAVIEAGLDIAGLTEGRCVAAIIFGMVCWPSKLVAALDRFFRYGQRSALEAMFVNTTAAGVVLVAGHSLGLPGISVPSIGAT
jgi:hypothetical protein